MDAASAQPTSEPEKSQESVLEEPVAKAVQHEPEEKKEEAKTTE